MTEGSGRDNKLHGVGQMEREGKWRPFRGYYKEMGVFIDPTAAVSQEVIFTPWCS